MNQTASLPAPPRRTRGIALVSLAIVALAGAAFAVRRPLMMSAPRCMAGRWHGCFDTENGVLLMMLVGLPVAAVVVAHCGEGVGPASSRAGIISFWRFTRYGFEWQLNATLPDGSPLEQRGRASDVLQRQGDGQWVLVVDNPWGEAVLQLDT